MIVRGIEVEICDKQLNTAIIKKLALQLGHLKECYEDGGMAMFYFQTKDRKKLKRLIKALERVLDLYEA